MVKKRNPSDSLRRVYDAKNQYDTLYYYYDGCKIPELGLRVLMKRSNLRLICRHDTISKLNLRTASYV